MRILTRRALACCLIVVQFENDWMYLYCQIIQNTASMYLLYWIYSVLNHFVLDYIERTRAEVYISVYVKLIINNCNNKGLDANGFGP